MDIDVFGIKQFKDKAGKVVKEEYYLDPLAEYVKPYVLTPRNADLNPTNPEQILVPNNGVSADASMEMVDEGMFEGAYLTSEWDDNNGVPLVVPPSALVEIINTQRSISITGRPCHVETIIGTGQRPFILAESLAIDKREPIAVRFYDLSASARRVRFQIHGQRMYSEQIRDVRLDKYIARRRERNMRMAPYMCPLDRDPLIPANATQDFYFTNDAQLYFEVRKITCVSTGPFKYKVTDEKSNGMQTDWVHVLGSAGDAQFPFIFYGPWLIKPGGKVTFTIMDLSGAAPPGNQIYLTLSGRQHFVYPGP